MNKQKMLESGRNTFAAVGAVIKFINWNKGFGFVILAEGGDAWFDTRNLCAVRPGDKNPRLIDVDNLPQFVSGTQVTVLKPYKGPKSFVTEGVCRLVDYIDAEREIARRPYFRLVHLDCRFNGKIQGGDARESVYAEGTLAELERKFPIGEPNDPLADGYKTAMVTVPKVRWDRRQADGSWKVQSTDPRRWAKAPEPKVPAVMIQPIVAKPTETPADLKVQEAPARKKAEKPCRPVKGSGQTAPTGVSVAPAKKAKAVQTVKGLDALAIAPVSAGK